MASIGTILLWVAIAGLTAIAYFLRDQYDKKEDIVEAIQTCLSINSLWLFWAGLEVVTNGALSTWVSNAGLLIVLGEPVFFLVFSFMKHPKRKNDDPFVK